MTLLNRYTFQNQGMCISAYRVTLHIYVEAHYSLCIGYMDYSHYRHILIQKYSWALLASCMVDRKKHSLDGSNRYGWNLSSLLHIVCSKQTIFGLMFVQVGIVLVIAKKIPQVQDNGLRPRQTQVIQGSSTLVTHLSLHLLNISFGCLHSG